MSPDAPLHASCAVWLVCSGERNHGQLRVRKLLPVLLLHQCRFAVPEINARGTPAARQLLQQGLHLHERPSADTLRSATIGVSASTTGDLGFPLYIYVEARSVSSCDVYWLPHA